MSRYQYVAMYETGERGKNFFRMAYLDLPDGYLPMPFLDLGVPLSGTHRFGWAEDQAAIARAFNTSQQNVSRWLKNKAPVAPTPSPQQPKPLEEK